LWKSVGLTVLLVVLALFFAWPHFEMTLNGYRIEQLQKEKDAEEEMTRQLRLEIETLRSPKRIEALAITRLHLVTPRQDEAIVLERVVPADLPASSIVASR
jgi:cell division protein FtsL